MNQEEIDELCEQNRSEGEKIMVFDWEKCAELILLEGISNAEAFLDGDEPGTGGVILSDNKIIGNHGAVLESYKFVPILRDLDTREEYPCYKYKYTTNWTSSAILLLIGGGTE